MTLAPLPVPTRCYAGEDLTSWANRHCSRNHTTVHAVERALFNRELLHSHALRDPERFTRWRQLGDLHTSAFTISTHIDGVWVTTRDLCLRCTRGNAATGRLPQVGWVCLRHRCWTSQPQRPVGQVYHREGDRRTRRVLSCPVLTAERAFRAHLAPLGVLVDSPLMLFALELAHLTCPTDSSQSWFDERPDPYRRAALYIAQVSWARLLTTPRIETALLDQSPAVRAAAITASIGTMCTAAEQLNHAFRVDRADVDTPRPHRNEPDLNGHEQNHADAGDMHPATADVVGAAVVEAEDELPPPPLAEKWRISHRLWTYTDHELTQRQLTAGQTQRLAELPKKPPGRRPKNRSDRPDHP